MKTKINTLFFTCFCAICIFSRSGFAQSEETPVVVPSISLSGPRFGVTMVNGRLSNELKSRWDVNPMITQFGWQFETRFFTMPSGTAGLVEWVLLVGGLEQNVFLPSVTCLIGLRSATGLEFGFGPNVSLAGASFAFAAGATLKSNDINFPINLAVVPSSRGGRVSLLIGFNKRKK
jgi:hypothetical protein